MLTYDEYKKIVAGIMNEIYNTEKQRRIETSKLIMELTELSKDGKLRNPERFVEILKELSVTNPIESIYDLERFDYSTLVEIE